MGCYESVGSISSTGNPPCRGYELTKSLDSRHQRQQQGRSRRQLLEFRQGVAAHRGHAHGHEPRQRRQRLHRRVQRQRLRHLQPVHQARGRDSGCRGGNPQKVYEYAGLFGDLGDDAKVSDLKLEDVWLDFQGPSASNPLPHVYAGGLAGRSAGTITGVSITGIIRGVALSASGSAKPPTVGGLVGYHDGGTITASYAASADVVADQEDAENNTKAYAGGLVGYNKSGTIQGVPTPPARPPPPSFRPCKPIQASDTAPTPAAWWATTRRATSSPPTPIPSPPPSTRTPPRSISPSLS